MSETNTYNVMLIDRERLDNEYYRFDFEKPEGYHFKEGQYAIFKLIDHDLEGKDFRIFSIAYTNEEPYIRIATRIPELHSDFKEVLLHMPVGNKINMSEPKGKFVLEPDCECVFIAGGIGITPIRSMILSQSLQEDGEKEELIYSELESCYPFKEELEHISGLNIDYCADIEPTQNTIRQAVKKYKNNVTYYISGSPGFVKGISGLLKENGVTDEHIKHDLFVGY